MERLELEFLQQRQYLDNVASALNQLDERLRRVVSSATSYVNAVKDLSEVFQLLAGFYEAHGAAATDESTAPESARAGQNASEAEEVNAPPRASSAPQLLTDRASPTRIIPPPQQRSNHRGSLRPSPGDTASSNHSRSGTNLLFQSRRGSRNEAATATLHADLKELADALTGLTSDRIVRQMRGALEKEVHHVLQQKLEPKVAYVKKIALPLDALLEENRRLVGVVERHRMKAEAAQAKRRKNDSKGPSRADLHAELRETLRTTPEYVKATEAQERAEAELCLRHQSHTDSIGRLAVSVRKYTVTALDIWLKELSHFTREFGDTVDRVWMRLPLGRTDAHYRREQLVADVTEHLQTRRQRRSESSAMSQSPPFSVGATPIAVSAASPQILDAAPGGSRPVLGIPMRDDAFPSGGMSESPYPTANYLVPAEYSGM